MKKILFILLFLPVVTLNLSKCFAQEIASMNLMLRAYVNENANSTEPLQLLVQGNESAIENAVKNLGGNFKYAVHNISAVTLPVNKINQLSQTAGIIRIEGRHGVGKILDDQSDVHANITPVKLGQAPLPQSYDGSGIVIGIIDTEIDLTHPDFIDAGGNSRVKYLWSQIDTSGGVASSYGYGQEWDSLAISAGVGYIPTTAYFGHGSVVIGAACGNPVTQHQYEGVAPKADIVFVAIDLGPNFLNNMVDATEFIYTKAALLGKPCVINASVGTYNGSHDGLDLPAQTINNLIAQTTGRSFIAAAGNNGNRTFHLQYAAEADSAFTWFKVDPATQNVVYELWAFKSQFDNLQFALGADLVSPYTYIGRTNYYNILTDFNFVANYAQLVDTLKTWSGQVIAPINIQAEMLDTTYHLLIEINTNNTANYYRLISKGVGRFDIWSQYNITGTSDMLKPVQLPPVTSYPDVARYRAPDQLQTIVSSFQCSDNVITVANFNNRNTWTDVNANSQTTTDTVGARGITSSIGPTRDGRMKPDISAPGNNTFGAGLLSVMPTFISNNPQKVGVGGQHLLDGGTSMASPVVAGIVALYMQRYPMLTCTEIKNAVIATAITDSFTTSLVPNIKWGFGKIDAFKLLDTLINSANCQPTSSNLSQQICAGDSVNFGGTYLIASGIYMDTLQNTGGCDSVIAFSLSVDSVEATIFIVGGGSTPPSLSADQSGAGITYQWFNCNGIINISGATNQSFDPVNDGEYGVIITDSQGCSKMSTCLFCIGDGIEELSVDSWNVYPNPVADKLIIESSKLNGKLISITDVLGKELFHQTIEKNSETIKLHSLSPGVYYCILKNGKTILAVRKIVKL